jgi:dolichol-phosphate mannosyltransferase
VDDRSTWIVIPTYNEAENVERLGRAVLRAVPRARILIVDDNSPDGTGSIADAMARSDPRVTVLHRPRKEGLGAAYRSGIRTALEAGADPVVQMDCDFSHDPGAVPDLLDALEAGADLALGSRYIPGGRTENWSPARERISRGGSRVARLVLGLPQRDLTGGFKAWRAALLERISFGDVASNGYGFQVEMTWRASRAGARIVEVPIVFRERVAGASKMTWHIVVEAAAMLVRLRARPWTPAPGGRDRRPPEPGSETWTRTDRPA